MLIEYKWSYPILVDIYSEPILSELCNPYPVDKPILSIPSIKILSTTTSYDGSTKTTQYIPTATQMVRANQETINIPPNINTNILNTLGLDSNHIKLNRRFMLMTTINLTETLADTSTADFNVMVNFRPDNRSQFVGEFEFEDTGLNTVEGQISGHINFEKATISYQIHYSGGTAGSSYVTNYAELTMRFVPIATMNGRTSVSVETEQIDVTIDPNEDFLINLSEEDMQDYSSIFKLDLIRTLSEAIKR